MIFEIYIKEYFYKYDLKGNFTRYCMLSISQDFIQKSPVKRYLDYEKHF